MKRESETLSHPCGDSIEDNVNDELIDFIVRQGPHEICALAFTGTEVDVLIGSLKRARRKVKVKP